MSAILKGYLQPAIQGVLTGFSTATYTGPPDGPTAQALFVDQLSTAIAAAVQVYLTKDVKVTPGQLVKTVGGPTSQQGATLTPGNLLAP